MAITHGYEPPSIHRLGSVHELTQQFFNKVGGSPDAFFPAGPIVGSVIPYP